jgi:hypothetical protein
MIILYPCTNFESLASDRTVSEAEELFAAWGAAYHPAVLEAAGELPRWESATYPPFNLGNEAIFIPPCCDSFLHADWLQQHENNIIIQNLTKREEIVDAFLTTKNAPYRDFTPEFAADFCALGTARFLTDLLARHLHYMNSSDDSHLKTLVFDSIKSYRDGDFEAANKHLGEAFDEIGQMKDNYYPIQNYFLDLTLVTETTTGLLLQNLLNDRKKINLFISSNTLKTLPEMNPETFAVLKAAVENKKVELIADDAEPGPLPLLPILDTADRILEGNAVFRDLLNVSPKIFGRLRAGLTPVLPQLLKLAGVTGAIHFAPLDGWRIKENEQSKMIWQGIDGTKLDTLVRYPVDASQTVSFFEFADQLGETISSDHAPTTVFAQFPGQTSSWLDDLRRMSKFATTLGKFMGVETYFDDTPQCGGTQQLGSEKYPFDALAGIETDPISHWNSIYRANSDRMVHSAIETILNLLSRTKRSKHEERPLAEQFAEAVTAASDGANACFLVVNPLSFPRRVFVENDPVEVPPLGYTFVEKGQPVVEQSPIKSFWGFRQSEPTIIRKELDDTGRGTKRQVYLLENEYYRAKIDATTGMLRSIFTGKSRYNQLSRQLGFRKDKEYSIQAADEITILENGAKFGKLEIKGRLVQPDGSTAAKFTETVTIRRKSRLLEFDLTLEPITEPGGNLWNSYYAVRYAWNDETLELRGGLNDGVHTVPTGNRLQIPQFVDLRSDSSSLTFFSEGLPFHRQFGLRQLDTLLICKGETQRNFHLAVGIDIKQPVQTSQEYLLRNEDWMIPVSEPPKHLSAWFFQIEAKNVVALYWEPVIENEKTLGLTVFLLETEGRRAHFPFRSFLTPKKAVTKNLLDEEQKELKIESDAVLIDMHGHELLPVMIML